MACSQTLTGIARDCAPSRGGVAEILIANHADVTAVTVTAGKVTAITMASSAKFYKYLFKKNSASFTSTRTINDNGGNYVASEITMTFGRMDTAKRLEIEALSLGDLAVIVKDRNGVYHYFGKDEPVTASGGSAQSGQGLDDLNGYQVVLSDNSEEYPNEVDADIIDDLL